MNKIFLLLMLSITIALFSGFIGFFIGKSTISDSSKSTSPFIPSQQACTMEAKICPDGSSVGRTGPNCEFSPCP